MFFGLLDANTGKKLWVSSAGGLNDDWYSYWGDAGNRLVTDEQDNLFIAVRIKDDFYVGSQYFSGNSGYSTYLLRCDLNGNLLQSFGDIVYNNMHYFDSG